MTSVLIQLSFYCTGEQLILLERSVDHMGGISANVMLSSNSVLTVSLCKPDISGQTFCTGSESLMSLKDTVSHRSTLADLLLPADQRMFHFYVCSGLKNL